MATVSIITATYNRSEVLRLALRSAIAQTFTDWELIVVGDACTDDTAEVVDSLADPRIRFVNRTVNFGEQSGPNNDGLALSAGRLIAYLNHDDLWFPDHLESLVEFIESERAELVYSLLLEIDRHGMAFCGLTNEEGHFHPTSFVPASLWLARREFLEGLGGWRDARKIAAAVPSRDLLSRAWDQGRSLRCLKRFTALVLASGGRPGCYRSRDDSQHRALFEKLNEPGFRETLATQIAERLTRDQRYRLMRTGLRNRLSSLFDAVVKRLGCDPTAVRNRLAGRRPGWFIDYLREFRGLPPH